MIGFVGELRRALFWSHFLSCVLNLVRLFPKSCYFPKDLLLSHVGSACCLFFVSCLFSSRVCVSLWQLCVDQSARLSFPFPRAWLCALVIRHSTSSVVLACYFLFCSDTCVSFFISFASSFPVLFPHQLPFFIFVFFSTLCLTSVHGISVFQICLDILFVVSAGALEMIVRSCS